MNRLPYKFKKVSQGRYTAIHPETGQSVGIVFGESNNWHAERLDGSVVKSGYPTKQAAVEMALRG
jgi:hypothetical protein